MNTTEQILEKVYKLIKAHKTGLLGGEKMPEDEIPTYESGMGLIPLLRDQSTMVRSSACEAAAKIKAKHCEQYVKKLAFADPDPDVRQIAKRAFDQLKDPVIT